MAMAEVVKAVGLKGEFKLYPLLDFHVPVLESEFLVWEDGRRLHLANHRPVGGCVVVRSIGCDSREAAEALVGRLVGFTRESYLEDDFPRPAQGLPFRWLGRPVVTSDGAAIGTVSEVRWTGGQYLLVVGTAAGDVLIPAVAPILKPDPGLDGDLIVDPPEGLFDVGVG